MARGAGPFAAIRIDSANTGIGPGRGVQLVRSRGPGPGSRDTAQHPFTAAADSPRRGKRRGHEGIVPLNNLREACCPATRGCVRPWHDGNRFELLHLLLMTPRTVPRRHDGGDELTVMLVRRLMSSGIRRVTLEAAHVGAVMLAELPHCSIDGDALLLMTRHTRRTLRWPRVHSTVKPAIAQHRREQQTHEEAILIERVWEFS